jgi:ribonucleotide reductase alpha subunit
MAFAFPGVQEFKIVQRRVYRWIDRKQVAARTEGDRKFVSRASVEELLRQEQLKQVISQVIDSDTTTADLKEGVTFSLSKAESERDKYIARIAEDARTIGELTQKTRHLDGMEIEVSGLRQDKITLTARYERFRVLFWVMLVLFVVVTVVFSVLLYVNLP